MGLGGILTKYNVINYKGKENLSFHMYSFPILWGTGILRPDLMAPAPGETPLAPLCSWALKPSITMGSAWKRALREWWFAGGCRNCGSGASTTAGGTLCLGTHTSGQGCQSLKKHLETLLATCWEHQSPAPRPAGFGNKWYLHHTDTSQMSRLFM